VVITYAGISLAVVELSEDLSESLAMLRAKMEEDEVPLRFAYSFTFQGTGALVTRKQVHYSRPQSCHHSAGGVHHGVAFW
jgi:hypothetical protein